jgi:hypothetical protein
MHAETKEELWSAGRGATIGLMLQAIMYRMFPLMFGPTCETRTQILCTGLFLSFFTTLAISMALVRERKRFSHTMKERLHDAWLHGFDFVFIAAWVAMMFRPVLQYLLTSVCR